MPHLCQLLHSEGSTAKRSHGDGDANIEVNDTPDVNGVVINTVADFHLDVKHQKSGSRHYRSIVTLGNLKISTGKRKRPF